MMHRAWLAAVATSAMLYLPGTGQAASPATPMAQITILDGEATVIRGTTRFAAAEGARLQADDIVASDGKAGLVRLEWPDGSALDLGAATQVRLRPLDRADKSAAQRLYVLAGWVKLSVPAPARPAAGVGYSTPGFEASSLSGVSVAWVGDLSTLLFVESGEARLAQRTGDKAPTPPLSLKAGQTYAQSGRAPGSVSPRLPAPLAEQMPRGFRDTLPSRSAKFEGRDVAMKALPGLQYAELTAWLTAEPALRREFVARFRPLAREAAFRAALVANLKAHPEWGPVLYPDPPGTAETTTGSKAKAYTH